MPVPDFSPGEVLSAGAMDQVGLWLVKSQTVGTGVSSVTVTGAFSSAYDNYRITFTGGVSSAASTDLSLQLVGATGNNYDTVLFYTTFGAGTIAVASTTTSNFAWAGQGTNQGATQMIDLLKPFLAEPTRYSSQFWAGGVGYAQGRHTLATSYTGFTIIPASGTLTGGTISVYGYKK